jgi:hypothetical protein
MLTDTHELVSDTAVWCTAQRRPWLSGRYVSVQCKLSPGYSIYSMLLLLVFVGYDFLSTMSGDIMLKISPTTSSIYSPSTTDSNNILGDMQELEQHKDEVTEKNLLKVKLDWGSGWA